MQHSQSSLQHSQSELPPPSLQTVYADLHVHIGRTEEGGPVKISASRDLTFRNIAEEASERKGIGLIGVIDAQAPAVQREISGCLERGEMTELAGGGIRYGQTTLLLGSEIEVRDPGFGPAHLLAYFRTFDAIRSFTDWLKGHMRNVELSSQRIYVSARRLQDEVIARGGIVVPAHIFTPHRSMYGSCTERMANVLDITGIEAVELGLSADSHMAGRISELEPMAFLTNSDAHSLAKIGREYNELLIAEPTFDEWLLALRSADGRQVAANYGLQPALGKYHRDCCAQCGRLRDIADVDVCAQCGSAKLTAGVLERIAAIADREEPLYPPHRPPYRYQVPLEFLPGLGAKTLRRLIERLGTEMDILHRRTYEQLAAAAGEAIASAIMRARSGELELQSGGGGIYGKVKS